MNATKIVRDSVAEAWYGSTYRDPGGSRLDAVECLCIAGSFKDVIELLLETSGLGQRPIAVLLMAEDNVFED